MQSINLSFEGEERKKRKKKKLCKRKKRNIRIYREKNN